MSQFFNPNDILLLGKRKPSKSHLVIGMPTVKRTKAFYLMDTLDSLMRGTNPQEREQIVIVVFIADTDKGYRDLVTSKLNERFKQEVEKGIIQVIVAPNKYYPAMESLPPLYGDTFDRVRWRSKQAIDYSFLYYYCSDLAEYYLQLEDDVLAESGYYGKIKDYIASKATTQWSTLEFGARGFIGMMYRGANLQSLARFSRFYFWTMPIDWIFRIYNDIFLFGNTNAHIRKPPLFKHIGAYSSLDGQIRKLEDLGVIASKGEIIAHTLVGKNNPPASVDTSIREYVPRHDASEPYKKGFFWGKTILVGSTITITFETKCVITRVAFLSGSARFPSDALEDSDVLISTASDCSRFELLQSFKNTVDIDIKNIEFKEPIKCLRLKLTSVRLDDHARKRWLIVREIGVWTK